MKYINASLLFFSAYTFRAAAKRQLVFLVAAWINFIIDFLVNYFSVVFFCDM